MNEVKKLNKQRLAKNVYRMIIESGLSIESVALSLDISERLIYYWQTESARPQLSIFTGYLNYSMFQWKASSRRVFFHFEQRFITKSLVLGYN